MLALRHSRLGVPRMGWATQVLPRRSLRLYSSETTEEPSSSAAESAPATNTPGPTPASTGPSDSPTSNTADTTAEVIKGPQNKHIPILPFSAIPKNYYVVYKERIPQPVASAKFRPKKPKNAHHWPIKQLTFGPPPERPDRPRFPHVFLFDYQGALDRIGKCIKWGCKEEDLKLVVEIVNKLATQWHKGAASAWGYFQVEGRKVVLAGPGRSLERMGLAPIEGLLEQVKAKAGLLEEDPGQLVLSEIDTHQSDFRKLRDGERVMSFTCLRRWNSSTHPAGWRIVFITALFHMATRQYIGSVKCVGALENSSEDNAKKISNAWLEHGRIWRDKTVLGRRWTYLTEKDIRRLESWTWNNSNAVEDLGSAVLSPAPSQESSRESVQESTSEFSMESNLESQEQMVDANLESNQKSNTESSPESDLKFNSESSSKTTGESNTESHPKSTQDSKSNARA